MLLRMAGLIAVVGSIEVAPENRRRRGRPTQEPFGQGGAQLQRVKGHGVIYLEPGRAKFHAVDLTDQNGASVDDDGAYLREELVFAFEEPISFENGKLSNDQLSLELAHLKGNGRIVGVEGLREFMRRYGEHVVEERLLPIGAQRRNWKQTLVSDGHILLRHPDWERANAMAAIAASEITLYAA
jgi:hypothetical protein